MIDYLNMAYQNDSCGAGVLSSSNVAAAVAGGGGGGGSGAATAGGSAGGGPGGNKTVDEPIKSQFVTREGTYKLMTLSEYSRPSRVPLNPHQGNNVAGNAPVRVSFVTLPDEDSSGYRDRICFNVGRELYVYPYGGVSKASDLNRPIDKRVYKGTFPTCHEFNQTEATADSCALLVGFSAGQIQLIDPFKKDCQINKLFNEERLIDKTRVTCLRWIPGAPHHFLVSHASGHMYVYNEDLQCGPTAPVYQLFKSGDGFNVSTCKAKSSRNPLYRWTMTDGAINEFAFSPDGRLLAVVTQGGYLRVFSYHSMELMGLMRSYFGGLLCLAWSPDAKYIVTGGEDDMVTVYSVIEKRLVCRGQGHKSWVSQVAFDTYTSLIGFDGSSCNLPLDSEEDLRALNPNTDYQASRMSYRNFGGGGGATSLGGSGAALASAGGLRGGGMRCGQKESISSGSLGTSGVFYRFGSVGHDTQLCLWDLTEEVLKTPVGRVRTSTLFTHLPVAVSMSSPIQSGGAPASIDGSGGGAADGKHPPSVGGGSTSGGGGGKKESSGKSHRRAFVLSSRNSEKAGSNSNSAKDAGGGANSNQNSAPSLGLVTDSPKVLGTTLCPYLHEIPSIEPLINKKIAHERLTVLVFREDCFVTACQEGFICTWARPGRMGALSHQHSINSPNPGGSPNLLPGGTIV